MPPLNINPYTEPERKPLSQILKNKKDFNGRIKNEIITSPTMPDAQKWLNTDKKLKEEEEKPKKPTVEKHIVATFGRMQPPHIGHEALVHNMTDIARNDKKGADVAVHLSKSHDQKKNPLPYSQKFEYAQKAFGQHIVKHDPKVNDMFGMAEHLYKKGYTHLTLVGGPDHEETFNKILKYNDNKDNKEKRFEFKKIEFVPSHRITSSTEMRTHVRNNDPTSFKLGLPTKLRADSDEIFQHVRDGMKINEAFKEMIELPNLSERMVFNILESRMDALCPVLTQKAKYSLTQKANEANVELNRLFEVYEAGCDEWIDTKTLLTQEQFAFIRVNQYLKETIVNAKEIKKQIPTHLKTDTAIKYKNKIYTSIHPNEHHEEIGKRNLGNLYQSKKHSPFDMAGHPDYSDMIIHGYIDKQTKGFKPYFESVENINEAFKKKIKKLEPALPGTKNGVGDIQSPLGIDAYIGEEETKTHKNKCPNCHDERDCKCSNGSNHMGAFCAICHKKFTEKINEAFERKGIATGNIRQKRWDDMTKDWVKCEHKCPHCFGTNYNAKKKGTVAKIGTWTHKVPPPPFKCKLNAIDDSGCVNCTQYPLKPMDEESLHEGLRFFRKIHVGPVQFDISKHGIGATIGTKHIHYTRHLIGGGKKKRTRLTVSGPRLPLVGRLSYTKFGTAGKKKKKKDGELKAPKNVNENQNWLKSTISHKINKKLEKLIGKFPNRMFQGQEDPVPHTPPFMGVVKGESINETGGAGGWGTNLLSQMYEKDTPGEKVKPSGIRTPDIIEKGKRKKINDAMTKVTNSQVLKN